MQPTQPAEPAPENTTVVQGRRPPGGIYVPHVERPNARELRGDTMIVIDPGHGFFHRLHPGFTGNPPDRENPENPLQGDSRFDPQYDTGARSLVDGMFEADVTMRYARALAAELERRGYSRRLTRDSDYPLSPQTPIEERTDERFIDRASGLRHRVNHAANAARDSRKQTIFISLHADSLPEQFTGGDVLARTDSPEARRLAFAMRDQFHSDGDMLTQARVINRRDLGVLNGMQRQRRAAVLLEIYNMQNAESHAYFNTQEATARYVTQVVDALDVYIGAAEAPAQVPQQWRIHATERDVYEAPVIPIPLEDRSQISRAQRREIPPGSAPVRMFGPPPPNPQTPVEPSFTEPPPPPIDIEPIEIFEGAPLRLPVIEPLTIPEIPPVTPPAAAQNTPRGRSTPRR
jgi:N-acetylmuramoyl-L-alanine amidase